MRMGETHSEDYHRYKRNVMVLMRGSIGNLSVKAIGFTLAFFAQILAARVLGAEKFGIYAYVLTWIGLLAVLADMGFSQASMRFIAVYDGQKNWGFLRGFLQYAGKIVFATAISIALLCAFGVWIMRERLDPEFLYTFLIAIAGLPVLSILQIRGGWMIALKKVIRAEIPQAVLQPFAFCTGVAVVILWFGLDANATTVMAINIMAAVIALIAASFLFYRILPDEARLAEADFDSGKWFGVAKAMLLIALLYQLILYRLDIIMVGAIVGPKEAGLYVVASNIAGLLAMVSTAVNFAFGPIIAHTYENGDRKELQRLVRTATRLVLFASSLLVAVFLVFGKWILGFYGEEFYSVYPVLAVLLFAHLLIALGGFIGLLFSVTGHHNTAIRFLWIGLFLNAVLNMALIPNYGALGASMATAFTALYWYVTMAVSMRRKLEILPFPFAPRG